MQRNAHAETFARLAQLSESAQSPELTTELRKLLLGKNNIAVAKAASVTVEKELHDLIPDLMAAFDRFMANPGKTDKGCMAKLAIVDALMRLDCEDPRVFLEGIHHVQMEPAYGPPIDSAANLRGNCALALARFGHPDILFELVTLLADKQVEARGAAVKALEYLGRPECELLLRLKALAGDAEPGIVCDCLSALIAIAPERSLDFAAAFLKANDVEIVEGAAVAIGQSHLPEGFALLREHWEGDVDQVLRKTLLLPIALTRLDEAYAFLLELLNEGHSTMAGEALKALGLFDDGGARREEIRNAVMARNDPLIAKIYRTTFE